ncbi:hypothetical protein Tco_0412753 [Tanacetum coccineum]
MGCSAVAVADPPPTACHGGENGWKSRRCCDESLACGVGRMAGRGEKVVRRKKCGEDSPEKSTRKFWHTLKEDGSKHKLKFMLDKKELTMTLDDFRTIFQLPQATNNYHERFVSAPKTNVVADALSRKERVKPKRVRAMNMILQPCIKDRILAAQKEVVDEFAGLLKGLYEIIELGVFRLSIKRLLVLQQPENPIGKWEGIGYGFVTKFLG